MHQLYHSMLKDILSNTFRQVGHLGHVVRTFLFKWKCCDVTADTDDTGLQGLF